MIIVGKGLANTSNKLGRMIVLEHTYPVESWASKRWDALMQDIFSIDNSHFLAPDTLVPQSHMTTIIALNADLWHKRKLESVVTLRFLISIMS
jgi:hypothetical protein